MGYQLTIDEGNTSLKVALWRGAALLEPDIKDTASFRIDSVMISSCKADSTIWRAYPHADIYYLRATNEHLPISINYSASLGSDRIAAAIGAHARSGGCDALVVDAGTAVTYDFVSADGVFEGGNIAPGLELRMKSLNEHTAVLPSVRAEGETPLLGHDTAEAIRAGAIRGIAAEIEYYHRLLAKEHPSVKTFITGGNASLIAKYLSIPFIYEPFLVMEGLKRTLDFYEDS